MKKIFMFLVAFFAVATNINAQPRQIEVKPETKPTPVRPAPESFAAKYEGGMFGYSKREQGTLKFEDANDRIVFLGEDGKEKFAFPYSTLLIIYPQSKSVQSTAGKVIGVVPYAGLLGGFIKEKRRYLVIHFDDPQVDDASGVVNFKIDDKDLLDSVIVKLAEKAELKSRGDAYYRPKKVKIEEK